MTEAERHVEYLICKRRGHQPGNTVTASMPPQNICRWCGTYYWHEKPELREGRPPKPPEESKP